MLDYSFAGLVVEEQPTQWALRYVFYGEQQAGWVHVVLRQALADQRLPSISARVHAADWHERSELQPDEHEGEHIEHEHRHFPHCI